MESTQVFEKSNKSLDLSWTPKIIIIIIIIMITFFTVQQKIIKYNFNFFVLENNY